MFMLQMYLKVTLNVCMTSELYLLDQGPSHGNPDVETWPLISYRYPSHYLTQGL